jgi:hypothetical protein
MNARRWPVRALAALLLTAPLLAGAQEFTHAREVLPGTALHQYVISQDHLRELATLGMAWDARLKRHEGCASQRFVRLNALMIYEPVTMLPASQHPTKGVWHERFALERCGESTTYNVVFSALPESKPRGSPLYPGESNANANLFLDASMVARVILAAGLPKQADGKHCSAVEIVDTRVVSRGAAGGAWDEAWTYTGCGAQAQLLGTFVPDGKGGTSFSFKLASTPAPQPPAVVPAPR